MKITWIFVLLLSSHFVLGQVKPEFFPEDIQVESKDLICLCTPGVLYKRPSRGLSIIYGYLNSGRYEAEGDTQFNANPSILNKLEFTEFKIKIPILLKGRMRLLLGYKYYSEFYDMQLVGEDFREAFQKLDSDLLKNNEFSVLGTYSLDDRRYLGFRYKYAVNGNYDGWVEFGNQYAIHSFMGILGFKRADALEWGVGLLFNSSFRRTTVLPFLLYNKTFDFKWGIESLFPANIFLRNNIDQRTVGILGIEYGSRSFRITDNATPINLFDYAYNHSELLASIAFERHLFSWFWGMIKGGFQKNFSNDFESKIDLIPSFQAEPRDGWFLRVGLFISPTSYE